MLKVVNTENLTGIKISGDLYDLQSLVDAFYAITISEDDEKYSRYFDISTRVLGLCYDIRHALMGDRDVILVENNVNEDIRTDQAQITPKRNVYYQCNYYYPEMIFITLAVNELLEIYIKQNIKPKNDYNGALNKAVIWDQNIAVLRSFQAAFSECVKGTLSKVSYTRWLNFMNSNYISILEISGHFLDHHNIKYLDMGKEQRQKKLSSIAKRIVEYWNDPLHKELKETAVKAAEQYNCSPSDLRIAGFDYPEEIIW